MSQTRRDFIKTAGAAGIVLASSDLIADILAQSPPGRVMESKFKGLADIALKEAKAAGCSYADIRFTRNVNSGVNASEGASGCGTFGGAKRVRSCRAMTGLIGLPPSRKTRICSTSSSGCISLSK